MSKMPNQPMMRSANPVLFPRLLGARLENLRFLLIGTCQVEHLAAAAQQHGHDADHLLYDSWEHSQIPSLNGAVHDAAIVGLTLRNLLQDAIGKSMDVAHLLEFWTEEQAETTLLRLAATLVARVENFRHALAGLPIFFTSFVEPSFNYDGNLIFSTSPANITVFIRRLNSIFIEAIAKQQNCYFFDVNQNLNLVGRAHLADDVVSHFTHASIIGDWDDAHDIGRMVAPISNLTTFDVHSNLRMLHEIIFSQLSDNIKILRQIDVVKLIVVDLDDTLWRGIAAEDTIEEALRIEGWPLGFAEALLYFKKRGGLLAICSKNDSEPTKERFRRIWGDRLRLEDFVSVKINWVSKSKNILEILRETNILAENTVFIDDNPREIDEVRAQLPKIRCLGGNHHDWRRIVLFAPETQAPRISGESRVRTQLVQAKIERDVSATALTRDEWLRSLKLEQNLRIVKYSNDLDFPRSFELLNKTNQFNTTGRRWTIREIEDFFASGGVALIARLKDKTIDNGLVGLALIKDEQILQTVLSCRVFGLGAELVLGAIATRIAMKSNGVAYASLIDTGKNATCREYFTMMGFTATNGRLITRTPCLAPDWIHVKFDAFGS